MLDGTEIDSGSTSIKLFKYDALIENLANENESNANLFITELNQKAENALENRLII